LADFGRTEVRIKTEGTGYLDDEGTAFLEEGKGLLDVSSVGRVGEFLPNAPFDITGMDANQAAASWAEQGFPGNPLVLLTDEKVFLAQGDPDASLGITAKHQFACAGTAATLWPAAHQAALVPGALFVIRDDGLWLFDFEGDTVSKYPTPP
jgi:hypothetical protein